jgi:hypothetical protein
VVVSSIGNIEVSFAYAIMLHYETTVLHEQKC